MEIKNTFYTDSRQKWRGWLELNFDKEKEVWLVYTKKSSGKPCILYNDAVEEALCFGWIDSTIKTIDTDHRVQRFTPRQPKSSFSQSNKERLNWLLKMKKIHPSIVATAEQIAQEKFTFPPDIIKAIKCNKNAWYNYQRFTTAYKRIRVAYVDSARKRPDVFASRLAHFIKVTEDNRQIGYGGIEKYF